jgi:RNA polymerase sigma-70 factor (ECF subfamily)
MAVEGAATRTIELSLVERARSGDTVAFEALLGDRIDPLFRVAWAILGSEADARDATQEACLSAWRELPRLRDTRAFDAWLHRVLVNACRMAIRRRSRVREVAIERIEDVHGAAGMGPEVFAETDAIARAFERLNPDQRTILVLHHLRHETVASIASALSVPPGTVKSRLHSARAALESNLAGERR